MSKHIIQFIKNSKYEDFDKTVIDEAKKCILDTVGTCIAGSSTKLSSIVNNFSKEYYKGDDAHSFIHGSKMSQLGALFVSAMSIDAFDMHDGYVLAKGHVGVSIVPAALLIQCKKNITGKELLANVVVGYEIATRAGIALHGSVDDYHTSGAWNSLGVCAIACRVFNLNEEEIKHALGICEFYAPRSQMMKIIDTPTMLKDGSGFGAFVGLKAALLAKAGFTGAPSLLIFSQETKKYWKNLGEKFEIKRQYFKPYPVCRWAQPSIEAIRFLNEQHSIDTHQIKSVIVKTFYEASRLNNNIPKNTEEAQYALKYPIVLMLLKENLTKKIVENNFKMDSETKKLFKKIKTKEIKEFNKQFPAKRLARVKIEMNDGAIYKSGTKEAIWGEDDTPSYEQIKKKFFILSEYGLTNGVSKKIEILIKKCENLKDIESLKKLL